MPHLPQIRNIAFRHALSELKRAGIPAERLLLRCRLRAVQAEDENGWIPFDAHAHFLNCAAEAIGDPFLGLRAIHGGRDLRDFGALFYVGRVSGDLLDALCNLERYFRLATNAWRFAVTEDSDFLVLEFSPERPEFLSYAQATECGVAGLIAVLREIIGPDFSPAAVHFVHERAAANSLAEYHQILGCKVQFQRNQCRVFLDKAALSRPIATSDPKLLAILQQHCDNVLQQATKPTSDLAIKARQAILDLMPDGRAKAAPVAAQLGLSERTLHRRLAEQDCSFRDLLDGLRKELALAYIREDRLSLQQVAYLLGYSEQSSFNVAFRRWTGGAPGALRSQLAVQPG